MLIVVLVSVVVDVAGDGLTTVVLVSVFRSAGVTVSVFCSQAASKDAAPAKMQMYFFISCRWENPMWVISYSGQGVLSALRWVNVHPPSEPSVSVENVGV